MNGNFKYVTGAGVKIEISCEIGASARISFLTSLLIQQAHDEIIDAFLNLFSMQIYDNSIINGKQHYIFRSA